MHLRTNILTILLFLGVATTLAAQATGTGVLVIAHGTDRGVWNESVKARLGLLDLPWPVEIGFLSSPHGNTIQEAVTRLERRGAKWIVAVPMFVSSFSGHYREIEYYLGVRQDKPDHVQAEPVKARAKFHLTKSIDYDPLISSVLVRRAAMLARAPARETVVLVAHGPNDDQDNKLWLEVLSRYAADLKKVGGFANAVGLTLRDDAPDEVRDAATKELRDTVRRGAEEGGTVVIPVLIGSGMVQREIRNRLQGLEYALYPEGLIESDAMLEWVTLKVARALDAKLSTSAVLRSQN